jgi:hypothetical protein
MVTGTQEHISPWTSGKWGFDPKQIGLVSPAKKQVRNLAFDVDSSSFSEPARKISKSFGRLPEDEILRLSAIFLFAASGFVLAVVTIVLLR